MTIRTDIHRPSAITPEHYDFVAFDYRGGSDLGAILQLREQREIIAAHQARTGGKWSQHEHGGSCYVCGAGALYLAVWHNRVANEYIKTGEDCARKMDMSHPDSNAFRAAIQNAREAVAGKKKAQAVLAEAGLTRAWEIYSVEAQIAGETRKYEENTITNIVGKLISYGSISDKQIGFIKILFEKIDTRPERDAAYAAKKADEAAVTAAAPDVPTGRIIITRRVLGVKTQESAWADVTKLLVQDLTGFKVWGTIFDNVKKGDLVTFTATVEPSNDDKKFGFYKRPSNGALVNEKTGEVIPSYPVGYETKEFPTQADLLAAQAAWVETYGNPQ